MHSSNKTKNKRDIQHHEPLPVGEVQEADWDAWTHSVGFKESKPTDFQITEKLPIAALEEESDCAFASVTRKSH